MSTSAETKTFTCISCPNGCVLNVSLDAEGAVVDVTGNTCAKGRTYAIAEATHPTRMVTAVVCVPGFAEPLSVKTREPVSKSAIGDVIAAATSLELTAPIAIGDTVATDVAGSGVDLVATKALG